MPTPSLALTRTVIGILQGIFLYWLYHATEATSWPATDPYAFAMMVTAGAAVPLLAIDGLGHLRPRTLGLWLVFATLLACGVAGYGVYRDATGVNLALSLARALFVIFFIFFIMQSLIVAGESEGRIVASYPRYFDVSWTLGVQSILALLFLAALWGLLWLGAALFNLINISFLSELIQKRWFAIPVTTMALAYSLHVTDVRANLVADARTLTLTLLSWLLPVMTLFAVLFVLALPVVGLEPLWAPPGSCLHRWRPWCFSSTPHTRTANLRHQSHCCCASPAGLPRLSSFRWRCSPATAYCCASNNTVGRPSGSSPLPA